MKKVILPTVIFSVLALSVGVVGYDYLTPEADLGNWPKIGENIFSFYSYFLAIIGLIKIFDLPRVEDRKIVTNLRQKVFTWLYVILGAVMIALGYWFTAICLVLGVFLLMFSKYSELPKDEKSKS